MKEVLKKVVLSLVTTVVLLVLAEIGFRLYTSAVDVYDIEMHKYARLLKRRSEVPGLTHEHVPNSQAHIMGVDVVINSLGMRDDELSSEKAEDEYRILLLGGSIAFGWGVPVEQGFAELLEEALDGRDPRRRVSVANAGIGNYNTAMELILLQQLHDLVLPDMVIVHYFVNDAEIIPQRNAGWLVTHSYLAAYLHVHLQAAMFARETDLGEYYRSLYEDDADGWVAARSSLLAFRDFCAERGIDLLVIVQPDLHDLSADTPLVTCYEAVSAFLEEIGIDFVDVFPVLNACGIDEQDLWVGPDDSHPNAEAHELIFEALAPHFEARLRPEVGGRDGAMTR